MVSPLVVSLVDGAWYRSAYEGTEKDERYREVVRNSSRVVNFVNPSTVRVKGESITVGRDSSNGIIIDNIAVSKVHCRFFILDGKWSIEDLGSTNGTFMLTDGRTAKVPKAEPAYLLKGEKIILGTTKSQTILQVDW